MAVGVVVAVSGCAHGPARVESRPARMASKPARVQKQVRQDHEPLDRPRGLTRIHADGSIELAGGHRVRLAGIRMRPVAETGEPDALGQVLRMVGSQVELEHTRKASGVAAYYKRLRVNFCKENEGAVNLSSWFRATPRYERGLLNETLIHMGLARYDSSISGLTVREAQRCAYAQKKYDTTLARLGQDLRKNRAPETRDYWKNHYRPLSRQGDRLTGMLSPLYQVRIAPGDLDRLLVTSERQASPHAPAVPKAHRYDKATHRVY